eukprot:m.481269 g.481269  ORF g.481269 m.481269 type:complete len:194 (+) comp22111_c0_seq1:270-851(+)
MDFIIGLVGDGFVLVAADTAQARSVVVMKRDLDKMIPITDRVLMLTAGDIADATNFGEFIQANLRLQEFRNGVKTSTWGAANYVRRQLADALRTREAYKVDLLLAGCDEGVGPQLFFMDNMAALNKVPFGAHGYGSFFTLSTLDRYYRPGLSLPEAKEVLSKCIAEVNKRFMVNLPDFKIRVVTAEGIRDETL